MQHHMCNSVVRSVTLYMGERPFDLQNKRYKILLEKIREYIARRISCAYSKPCEIVIIDNTVLFSDIIFPTLMFRFSSYQDAYNG